MYTVCCSCSVSAAVHVLTLHNVRAYISCAPELLSPLAVIMRTAVEAQVRPTSLAYCVLKCSELV